MRAPRSSLAITAAAAVAVGAEWVAFDPAEKAALRVADGVVGFVVLCSAWMAWQHRRASPIGLIMGFTGLAWFAGSLWPGLVHLHRGPLVHLHVSYPSGRLRWWPAALTVVAAYVVATVEPFGNNDVATIVLSVVVAVVAAGQYLRTSGTARRAGMPALFAAWTFAGVLGLAALGRRAGWRVDTELLWAYYAAVAIAVTVLVVDFLRARWSDAVVADLVIDLGRERGSGTLRAAVGRALGDPNVVLAYWLNDERRYVDDAGRPVDVARPAAGQVATEITRDGALLAMLLHDAAVLDDPALVEAVAAGAGLAMSNARMQAGARERVDQLTASRRRIIEAGDAQRRRFGRELNETIQTRLASIADTVRELRACGELPAGLVDELARDLHETSAELDSVAAGLYPRALTDAGLSGAIAELSCRLGVHSDVVVSTSALPLPVEATVFYLCAEAMTNVAKHAAATRVRVAVSEEAGLVTAIVHDDGVGGADMSHGSGLRGLLDRVAAVGGTLTIESPRGGGTRLHAVLPR